MLIRRWSRFERLRNPTNVSVSSGDMLPTPVYPRKERRKGGEPLSGVLTILLLREMNSPPTVFRNRFHPPQFI